MKPSNIIRVFLIMILPFLFVGCMAIIESQMGGHPHDRHLGRIDLSLKGARCEGRFRWNSHGPNLELRLSKTNALVKPIGTNSVQPLVVQLDVFDKDKLVMSSQLDPKLIGYPSVYFPVTRLVLPTSHDASSVLQAGHSYKFVLTVLQEKKNLGFANVYMSWVTAGTKDSM
jgi:hypothetical protein